MEIVGIFNGYIKQTFELDPHYEYIDNKSAFGPLSRYEVNLK
jgi:hypothetical protein